MRLPCNAQEGEKTKHCWAEEAGWHSLKLSKQPAENNTTPVVGADIKKGGTKMESEIEML